MPTGSVWISVHVTEVLVFAIGNPSRGDDALGPLLCSRLEAELGGNRRGGDGRASVRFVEDFQLQIEHVLDMEGADMVLFVDAGRNTKAPFEFCPVWPVDRASALSHALEPDKLLALYPKTLGHPPPPAFLLCVAGVSFDLGAPLSGPAQEHLEQACAFIRLRLLDPEVERWLQAARPAASGAFSDKPGRESWSG